MWILILTLVASNTSAGQSIAAVSGFTSEQACISAGNNWQQQVSKTGGFRVAIPVCAKA